ncbi:hypothetical protein Jab_1c20540 [Janthinobacterium sp. HH01]|nr:hypothetical protein Jab_1c20540 [Janthinobacterium sp. HH01]
MTTLTSRLLLGAALSLALLGGCNKRPADQPTPSVTTPSDATTPPPATPPAQNSSAPPPTTNQ